METQRLILDPVRETDKEDFFTHIAHDKKVLETFLCRYAETPAELDFSGYPGNPRLTAIRLKETGRLIGILSTFDETDDSCEIGYAIGSGYWGQGYVTEAVGRFLAWLTQERGFRTVTASFFTGNEASRRVMEKCGMTYSHFSPGELTYLGVPRDLTHYVFRREEKTPAEKLVLLLNGPSSSGKSTLARVLQRRLLETRGVRYEIVSIDDFLDMSPQRRIYAEDVLAVVPQLGEKAAQALRTADGVLVDHVITSEEIYLALTEALAGAPMKQILVTCDPAILRQREAARGDRHIGSAEDSLAYLYPREGYDLCLDSGREDPETLARRVLEIL